MPAKTTASLAVGLKDSGMLYKGLCIISAILQSSYALEDVVLYEKEPQITNQRRDPDYFLTLNLQKGFAGFTTLEVQSALDEDEEKNFEKREESMRRQILELPLRILKTAGKKNTKLIY